MKRFTRFFLFTMMLVIITSAFAFAGDTTHVVLTPTTPQDTITLLLTILTPLVVYGATWLVGFLVPKLPSVLITTLVVPALSAVAVLIASLLGGTNPWYIQLGLGLVATFVHEFQNNVKQAGPAIKAPTLPLAPGPNP